WSSCNATTSTWTSTPPPTSTSCHKKLVFSQFLTILLGRGKKYRNVHKHTSPMPEGTTFAA
ncbi:MAG: hypothetical protein K2H04_08965, partial [Bacteroidaceae bacterium]|nr:hypothetical protein [Bacteroidaceae bacterium]